MKNAALFREKLITKIYFLDSKDREASYLEAMETIRRASRTYV